MITLLIASSSFIIIFIKLVLPPERTWIFLVPYFLIVIDNGFSSLNLNLLSKKKLFYSVILSFAISFLFIIKPFLSKPFTDIESQAFPEAEQTIKYLETQRILVGKEEMGAYYLSGTTMPLNYYNWLHNGKLYFNDGKVYSRMSFYESFKIDWQRWRDEDEEEEEGEGLMNDFSNFTKQLPEDFLNKNFEDMIDNNSEDLDIEELEEDDLDLNNENLEDADIDTEDNSGGVDNNSSEEFKKLGGIEVLEEEDLELDTTNLE